MDHNISKQKDIVDLESGGTGCVEDRNSDSSSGSRPESGLLNFDGSIEVKSSESSYNDLRKSAEVSHKSIQILVDKNPGRGSGDCMPPLAKNHVKEKSKKSSKKALKPPRPPKGPSLDITDLKLVKEISELAMKKHARIERMKELKKLKASKSSSSSASSSNSILSAMIITLLFFLVIIFQGFCSRHSSGVSLQGSTEPVAASNGLISVQMYNNLQGGDSMEPSSQSSNSLQQASGSRFRSLG